MPRNETKDNLVLTDFDETLFRAEGPKGYFDFWLQELARRFSTQLRAAGVSDAGDLQAMWYDYKQALQAKHGSLDYEGFNKLWQRDTRNVQGINFDPVSFFSGALEIEAQAMDDWLLELEERGVARRYLYEGALTLWQQLEEAPDTAELIVTLGGNAYQRHKVAGALGRTAVARTHVINKGVKGAMVNEGYNRRQQNYQWRVPGQGTITAQQVALLEDSLRHLEPLCKSPNTLGVYLPHRERKNASSPLVTARSLGEVALILRENNFLPQ